MRAFKVVIGIVLVVVGLFYILPATLLQVPYFQKKISLVATEYLQEKIGTKVEIQQIELRFLNKLAFKNVYMEDQAGDTLLTAKKMIADFDFIPLFRRKFYFSSIHIYTFHLHLSRETEESPLNIRYIIEAFSDQTKKKENAAMDARIKNLFLGNGNFSYRVKNKNPAQGKFNPEDIYLSNVNARIKLDEWNEDSIIANIKRLNFIEKSGFQVKHLAFDLAVRSGEAQIEHLHLELPQSNLHLTKIVADYEKKQFDFQIEPSFIQLKDISPFVPAFSYFQDLLEIKGTTFGTLDDIHLTDWVIKKENAALMEVNTNIRNLSSSRPDDIYINGAVKNARMASGEIQKMVNNFSPQPVRLPEPVERLGAVSLTGEVSGYLTDLNAFINLTTDAGDLRADVNFGKGETGFLKGKISTSEIKMKELLNSADFGTAGFEIDLDATFSDAERFNGSMDLRVDHFDYKSYPYENIRLAGDFTSGSFKGSLNADTPDGQVDVTGFFLLKGEDSEFDFSAKVSGLRIDKLNLTRKYKKPELSFSADARLKGNNPDNLTGNIAFRHFLFSTDKGSYPMQHLSIHVSEIENQKQILLHSDIANGKIEGLYSIRTLIAAL
jgi:hypothetical protein